MRVGFLDLAPPSYLRPALDAAYERVMSSGSYLRNREVERFEDEWAGYVGGRRCVAVQSGSEALRLLVSLWPNCKVAVPWNSTPTIDALRGGEMELFPTGDDLNMATGERYCYDRLLIPVHLYGNPAVMERYREGYVIEDACQAHGARYGGRMCGTFGRAAAWSFYPTKNLGAYGDAGAVTTDDDEIASRLRALRSTRMDALQAAFLSVKLPYLDSWNERRREIAARYKERIEGVGFPAVNPRAEPNYHLFVVLVANRARLAQRLLSRGVETMVHYSADDRVLSLPCNPNMTDEEVEYVIEAVNGCR